MPTTDEYWDVDGFVLNGPAYNLSTLTGRMGLPVPKGPDVSVPYSLGDRWRPKASSSRNLTLSMWVTGSRGDQTGDPVIDDVAAYNDNLRSIIRACYVLDRQIALTKRFRSITDGGLVTATAQASYAGGIDPSMVGRTLGKFGIDFKLSDPWFYGATQTTPSIAVAGFRNIVNSGDVDVFATGCVVVFTGPLTNPTITCHQAGKTDVTVTYTGVLAAGDTVTLDVSAFTAILNHASVLSNVIGAISHTGHRQWLASWKGTTRYTLTASAGTGTATVGIRPAYA